MLLAFAPRYFGEQLALYCQHHLVMVVRSLNTARPDINVLTWSTLLGGDLQDIR